MLVPQDHLATRVSRAQQGLKALLAPSDLEVESDPRGPVVLRGLRGLLGKEAWQGPQAVLEQQARLAALARVGRVARRGRLVLQESMDLSE